MTHVIDFSWTKPAPKDIKDAGFVGVIGYIGTDTTGKLLEGGQFSGFTAAGLSVTLVWETYARRSLDGYKAGLWDAQQACHQADELGYAEGCCIYYNLEDPSPLGQSDWPAATDYARGVRDAGGPYLVGGYGSAEMLSHVAALGLLDHQWIVRTWDHGHGLAEASLVQTVRYELPKIENVDFGDYDEDLCVVDDWGQHGHEHAPRPVEDHDVAQFALIKGDTAPGWYLTDWMYRRWVRTPEEARVLAFSIRGGGGRFSWDEATGGPNTVPQSVIEAIPILPGSMQAPGRRFPR